MTAVAESSVEVIEAALKALPAGRQLMLNGVSWAEYERCLDARDRCRPRARLSYDHGRLELMTKSYSHEQFNYALGRFVSALAEELSIPLIGARETTIRREDLERGFEPDEWFYVGPTATRMIGVARVRDLDFAFDPPPDLALEIEITRSLLDRIELYAALGVREIWRYDGETLSAVGLKEDRTYEALPASLAFPTVPLDGIVRFLDLSGSVDDATLVRRFREWVRTLAPVAG